MKKVLLSFGFSVLFSCILSAQLNQLLSLENVTNYNSFGAQYLSLNDQLYFSKGNRLQPDTLWQTDGLPANTQLKTVFSGTIEQLATIDEKIAVITDTGFDDLSQLWIVSPDDSPPLLVQEVNNGQIKIIFHENDYLLFNIRRGNINAIWRTDGTVAGTSFLFDLGHQGSNQWEIRQSGSALFMFDRFGSQLYVLSPDGQSVLQSSNNENYFRGMAFLLDKIWLHVGNEIWVFEPDGSERTLFWETDGKTFDLVNGIETNGWLLFSAEDEEYGIELWRTDGTPAGTVLVQDINTDIQENPYFPKSSVPRLFFKQQDQVYFIATPESYLNPVLYRTDGSQAGTEAIIDLWQEGTIYSILDIHAFQQVTLLEAKSGDHGREYWLFENDEIKVAEISPGSTNLFLSQPFLGEQRFFINAEDGIHGRELWRISIDGQTALVADLNKWAKWSNPVPKTIINGLLIFEAEENMKKSLYSVPVDYAAPQSTPPPSDVAWLKRIQNLQYPSSYSVTFLKNMDLAIDREDNLLISGYYESFLGLSFSGDEHYWPRDTGTIGGSFPAFFAKIDREGNTKWVKPNLMTLSGSKNVIATNGVGDAIVSGVFKGNLQLGPQAPIISSGRSFFLATYDQNGEYLWSKRASIGSQGEVFQCEIDGADNIYVAGYFTGSSARFDNVLLDSENETAYFLAKFDAQGNVLWAKTIETDPTGISKDVVNLRLDQKGNAYMALSGAGYNYYSSCRFQDHATKVVRIGADGSLDWEIEFTSDDLSFPTALALADNNRLYLTGRFRGTMKFGNHSIFTDCENSKSFLIPLSLEDGAPLGPPIVEADFAPFDLQVDQDGYVYWCGLNLVNDLPLPEDYQQLPFPFRGGDLLVKRYTPVLKLDAQKSFKKSVREISLSSDNNPQFILDSEQNIIIQDIKIGMIDTLAASSPTDFEQEVYLMKFSLPEKQLQASDGQFAAIDLIIAPNPASEILQLYSDDLDFNNARLRLFNMLGQEIPVSVSRQTGNQRNLFLSHLPGGRYFIQIALNGKVYSQSFIKA